jgi:hypothetical protein
MKSFFFSQAYVKEHHTTGLVWNPAGGAASTAPSAGGPPPPPPGPPLPPPPPPPGWDVSKKVFFLKLHRIDNISECFVLAFQMMCSTIFREKDLPI